MAPRLRSFILGTMAFCGSKYCPPLSLTILSSFSVKAQIPIQPCVPSDHKTSQLMPHRKTGTEVTGHACDCHCAHRAARSCEQHRCHTNKAPKHQPEQNTVPEGSENTNNSILHRNSILHKGYTHKP